MRFLRLLFWSFLALLALMFLVRNWNDVTVDLWGNLQADVKLPLLLMVAFLLGWIPTAIGWRIRLWKERRARLAASMTRPAPLPVAIEPQP